MTILILIVTIILSYYCFSNERLLNKLILYPYRMNGLGEIYRLLTSSFIHADSMHLIFNMMTLFFFGGYIEKAIGGNHFIAMYLLSGILSSVPSMIKHKQNPHFASLGASGAVSAIVFAMIYLQPWTKILVFFIPVPAVIYGVLFVGYSWYMGKKGNQGINHDAHLWGALCGFVYMFMIDPSKGKYFIDALLNF